jgi:hypothetical protein
MPDNIHPDQYELQQATARSLPAAAAISAGRTAERDGFLALGAALEAASRPLDEAALIAKLKESCLDTAVAPVALPPPTLPPPRTVDSAWQTALTIGLAAAALFALARIAVQSPAVQQRHDSLVAQHEPPPANANPDVAAEPLPAARTAWSNPVWLDPLDEELALAQAAFETLSAGDAGVDGSLTRMNDRLEALSQELYGGSL